MGRLNAGQLNQRIVLLTPGAAVKDAGGYGFIPGAATETPIWARVRPLSGRETLSLGQVLNAALYEVTIRYRPDARANQRLTWQGKTLNVQAVAPDEHNEYQLLTCTDGGQ
jgi:SPP1 family predicted phage head-tail adaptor